MGKVRAEGLTKVYGKDDLSVIALDGVSFEADSNEFVVILGASGSGKSTTLNIMGGMDNATNGRFLLDGNDITGLNQKQLAQYRRNDIGFVFQFYNLMPNLTALENVALASTGKQDSMSPQSALTAVGLKDRMKNFPSQLSGGEQQRVAIARAIVKNPRLLLCDEPTGALDSKTGKSVIELLIRLSREADRTVIIVTHNAKLAELADRVIRLCDGRIIENYVQENPKQIEDIDW